MVVTHSPGPFSGRSSPEVRFRVVALTRSLARSLGEQLAAIDEVLRAELGDDYSHQTWDVQSFLLERPGKWDHSCLVLDAESGVLVGFWIASASEPTRLHTHRVGVVPQARGHGVARAMFACVLETARDGGITRMTLTVGAGNDRARRLYSRLGFQQLQGEALVAFSAGLGSAVVAGDSLLIEGRRYIALELLLEGCA